MVSKVFMICDAYESGFGHGLKQDGLDLSKTPHGNPEHGEAYQIGYEAGVERANEAQKPTNQMLTVPQMESLIVEQASRIAELEQAVKNKDYARDMLLDHIADLEKDAARYRWLRHADLDALAAANWKDGPVYEGDQLDAAIDAAMQSDQALSI